MEKLDMQKIVAQRMQHYKEVDQFLFDKNFIYTFLAHHKVVNSETVKRSSLMF